MRGDAAIVGGGPNGLAAAIVLARAGVKVRVHEAASVLGGGLRTEERTLPGFHHDVCSAIHPFAASSPFFSSLPLCVGWIHSPIALAHPLDDGSAGVLLRSVDETARRLGSDLYRRLMAPLASNFAELQQDFLGPLLRVPSHPLLLAGFGVKAALPASWLIDAFDDRRARALLAGIAAHAFLPLTAPFSASFALVLAAAGHHSGWPFPLGGSKTIADALALMISEAGGEVVLNHRVRDIAELERSDAVLFDTTPAALEQIAGDRLPSRYRRALRRFRPGPGVFKLDYALAGPVPWRAAECHDAATVHLGGTFEEIAASEAAVARGEHPERPFVLIAQQSLFDSSRAPPGKHTLWAYCHVPHGSTFDMTARLEAQLERFAPGFKDLVLTRSPMTTADLEAHNANLVGGDITGGANDFWQLLARPRLSLDPYATPAQGIYLCSASTPPGAGIHGMCGYHAARSALRRTFHSSLSETGGRYVPTGVRTHHAPVSRRSFHELNR